MSYVLQVKELTKIFTGKRHLGLFRSKELPYTAVSNISFNLKEGEILGILGPNGAGKTTLIEMLLGTLKPTSGEILYFGNDFSKKREASLQFISHASAYNKLPSYLTIQENLEIFGSLYAMPTHVLRERILFLLKQFKMIEFKNRPAATLSAGQMTRVMLIKAFLSTPKIVLLDEPTASLDPDIAKEVRSFILQEQKVNKVSLILTSHNMMEVAEVCDRALVLQRGVVTKEDTPELLAKSVSLTKLTLTLTSNQEKALAFLTEKKWHYQIHDGIWEIELDEGEIPSLLSFLGRKEVEYSHIDITKPTLEDYFLHLTRTES